MKIAYLGIDLLYPALPTLFSEGCEILKIFTCPCDNKTEFNTQVVAFAEKHGIPYTVNRITKEDLAVLEKEKCDFLICAGYYYLVPMTDAFPMINIHPAPLPDCRGAWPMPLILLGAYPYGGIAMQKLAAKFDTGDIILQESFPILPTDTLVTYTEKTWQFLPSMIHTFLQNPKKYLENAKKQGKGRYLENPGRECYTVRDTMSVEEADRILKAFYSYECYYQHDGKIYELIFGRAVPGENVQADFPVSGGYIEAKLAREL